jgi:hypothetical protein
MTAKTHVVVYNGGEHPAVVDEEGHTVDPGDYAEVKRSFVKPLIDNETLIVIKDDDIKDDSNPNARMARDKAKKKNDHIDAEKAKNDKDDNKPVEKPGTKSSDKNK